MPSQTFLQVYFIPIWNKAMKKNHSKSDKSAHIVVRKAAKGEAAAPYTEKPSKDGEGLAAHDLFSLFTADIIQENVTFTR